MNPFADLSPPYRMIMADPPWRYETWSDKGKTPKGAGGQYSTMMLPDIAALPVASLAAHDCMLWLWATNPMLPQALQIAAAWGFTFKTAGTWVKRTKHGKLGFGTGYILRCASEPFILATRGKPKTVKNVRTVIEGRIREHSRKPVEAYSEAERLLIAPGRRLDLFTRETRPGWDAWGDEADKFDEAERAA